MGRLKKYVLTGTVVIIASEGFLGGFLLYFVFPAEVSNSLLVALVTALSFATVGEAVLLPILAEFKVIRTTFGQLTLGIGTLDDIIEVLMLAAVAVLPGFMSTTQAQSLPNPAIILADLGCIVVLSFALLKLGDRIKSVLEKDNAPSYVSSLLTLLVCFSFIALGGLVFESLATVGAIFGGIVFRGLLPKERLAENERAVEFLGYVFLSPIFFLSIGASVSIAVISPLLLGLILIVANTSKYITSFLVFHNLLGVKYSLLLGVGLGVRFSTSIIVQFILLNSGLISVALYSALIATAIIMKPIIIGIYSWVLSKGKPP